MTNVSDEASDKPASLPNTGGAAAPSRSDPQIRRFLWLMLALFLSYLCVAMSLPVTAVYVTTRLGLGNASAGLAVGITFASTILTRGLAGRMADHWGSKRTMILGLWGYALARLVCAAATSMALPVMASYAVLLAGRLLLGVGESLTVVGLIAWCFGIMGPQRSGMVFSLVGMAAYGAVAVGSPTGLVLFEWACFVGVMGACAFVPLVGLAMALPIAAVVPHVGKHQPFWRIIGRIIGPGVVLALAGVGSAAIGAFVPLFFQSHGWPNPGLGLSCFGGAFVLVRILFGHLPDRIGSIPVAFGSIVIEGAGQYLLWAAASQHAAIAGAFLSGLGCSLMFPAMGIEVVRRVPPHLRGTAAGGLAAFQDLAFGVTGPVAGLLADHSGYGAVFLVGGLSATLGLGFVIAIALRTTAQSA